VLAGKNTERLFHVHYPAKMPEASVNEDFENPYQTSAGIPSAFIKNFPFNKLFEE